MTSIKKEETDVYQLLADKLGLKETSINNKWTNTYRETFYLSKYGFRRILPGKQFFTNEEVLEILEVLSAEIQAGGTLSKDIPKWFENEIKRRK